MAGFEDLPDELLVSIFDLAGRYEDHRGESRRTSEALYNAIPAVCRRWRRLSLSPLLLRDTTARLYNYLRDDPDDESQYMACLRSLCAWLGQGAAGHMRSLELDLCPHEGLPPPQRDWRPEAHALVSSALAACGAAGSLRELSLSGPYGLEVGSWVHTLHALRTLRLGGMYCTEDQGDDPANVAAARAGNVRLTASLQALTGLHSVALSHLNMEAFEPNWLPPTLTLLSLQTVDLPHTLPVLGLTRLRRLELLRLGLLTEDIQHLERMPALNCLLMISCSVPDPLRLESLPALRTLCIYSQHESLEQHICEAVGRLSRLMRLELYPGPASWDALQHLTGLHGLYMQQLHVPLPTGAPWLRILRWAVLPIESIAQSRPALEAASHLQQLCILCRSSGTLDAVVPVLAWVHRLPSLMHLDVNMCSGSHAGITAAVTAVRRRRPSLTVTLDGHLIHELGLQLTHV